MNQILWRLTVTRSRLVHALQVIARAPRVYVNWPTVVSSRWKHALFAFHMRNGIVVWMRPGTSDRATVNEVLLLDGYSQIEIARHEIVVDVGANIGAFTLLVAPQCLKVIAIEPVMGNFEMLQHNVRSNRFANVCTIQAAVSDRVGSAEIHVAGSLSSLLFGRGPSEVVSVTTLENLMCDNDLDHIDLLKLDCEGSEFSILYASEHLLPRVNRIIMEYHNGQDPGHNVTELAAWLHSRGYSVEHDRTPWNGHLNAVRSQNMTHEPPDYERPDTTVGARK